MAEELNISVRGDNNSITVIHDLHNEEPISTECQAESEKVPDRTSVVSKSLRDHLKFIVFVALDAITDFFFIG
ncbi:MAG: hypothetical protein F4X56_01195 [Gammaproteobacteria bacterium]|nr:hypothetical protein [Gammaproteobacteria bacterium]